MTRQWTLPRCDTQRCDTPRERRGNPRQPPSLAASPLFDEGSAPESDDVSEESGVGSVLDADGAVLEEPSLDEVAASSVVSPELFPPSSGTLASVTAASPAVSVTAASLAAASLLIESLSLASPMPASVKGVVVSTLDELPLAPESRVSPLPGFGAFGSSILLRSTSVMSVHAGATLPTTTKATAESTKRMRRLVSRRG